MTFYDTPMNISDALRTTGAVRAFESEAISDDTLYEILDDARFAPSGGNRQAWRVVVVKDVSTRARIRDLYLDGWHDYVAHLLSGLIPFSPLASEEDRLTALAARDMAEERSTPDGFPETLDRVPVLLCIVADLASLAATDRDLGRYTFVGGASLYPFVWNILLAARARGLGGVITTIATRREREVLEVLGGGEHDALAAVVALGRPVHQPTKLKRKVVEDFVFIDRLEGERLQPPTR
jgi:nitroreductase